MNERIKRVVEIAKSYNISPMETNSTDVENTIRMEHRMEIEELYRGVERGEVREDIIYIMDLLKKIERSHGGESRGKDFLLDTLLYLEKI
ncbi:hypothetical protein PM10SUCC1_01290 [Propionigenium maris DSM 9537]|jgi:hypothetical protein|uniref:Uncharacterized protein n=1 Tax=Propionigenium maris DSM 9537 TaxID=1123000 RepID=A0A9W6GIP7_9FUSO|nr:hypothetical protein [Propionigenium maris]GLI54614.1 hypothetical protein PM10SUCC1_01290 [Propionigenium maris DSM 9537]